MKSLHAVHKDVPNKKRATVLQEDGTYRRVGVQADLEDIKWVADRLKMLPEAHPGWTLAEDIVIQLFPIGDGYGNIDYDTTRIEGQVLVETGEEPQGKFPWEVEGYINPLTGLPLTRGEVA